MRGHWLLLLATIACGGATGGVDADDDGVSGDDDCDDSNADVFPGADEVCDGVDNDCDGDVDDDDDGLVGAPTWWLDADGDGFGGEAVFACTQIAGTVTNDDDCDDAAFGVNPDAAETCNLVDDDCDALVDDADDDVDLSTGVRLYRDSDGDGFGSSAETVEACAASDGWVEVAEDCDDDDADRNPGAAEVCDGKDNNCDVATGFLVDTDDPAFDPTGGGLFYADADDDGYGAGEAILSCTGGDGLVANALDCDDDDDAIFPGQPELCDGVDNDCDGQTDSDEWWNPAWPYRVPVTITGPAQPLDGPAVAVDVALRAALDALGDSTEPVVGSYRLVYQDCVAGFPQVPFDFVGNARGLLDPGVNAVFGGVGNGTLAFRHDSDGDPGTADTLPAGATRTYALYFTSVAAGAVSGPPVPVAPGGFTIVAGGSSAAPTTIVENGVTRVELDPSLGGQARAVERIGRSNVAGMATSDAGNGVYFGPAGGGPGGAWVQTTDNAATTFTEVFRGDVVYVARAIGESSGTYGGYDFSTTWVLFNGRPEVYSKVWYRVDRPSNVGPQNPSWTYAVRPWQLDNDALLGLGGVATGRDAAFRWVRASYDDNAFGVLLGWRALPLTVANPIATADARFLALVGQSFEEAPTTTEIGAAFGDVLLDHEVVVAYPYIGTWGANDDEILATLEGVSAVTGAGQARP